MPSLQELNDIAFMQINSGMSIEDVAKTFANRESWPFNLYLELLQEYLKTDPKKRRALEQDIYNQAYAITRLNLDQLRQEVLEIHSLSKHYVDTKDQPVATATNIFAVCKDLKMYDILNLLSPFIDEYYDLAIPEESRHLFADSLLKEKDEQIRELISFYQADIDEAAKTFVDRFCVISS